MVLAMWIDTEDYIGPCRRGGRKLRLLDRRHGDQAGRDPSLAALMRQLRANALDLSDAVQRVRFKLRLSATIALARRTQQNAAAQHLARLDAAMDDRALRDPRSAEVIERLLEMASAAFA